jgi:predicted Rossmann fold nucleotide-binding protein DprA/Smf involved in DNA uptake
MNNQALTTDTETVLLLCGRFGGERQEPFQPLSTRDYGKFAQWLNLRGLRPADLMTDSGRTHLTDVHEAKLERLRLEFLLGRGTAMALALERWSRAGIWVISRGDPEFPRRLKHHLKHAAPPLLYGAGDKAHLDRGGLGIVGSRDATDAALEFTREVAVQCAREGFGVVSGGARGVDATAMQAATEAGGHAIGVLASDLLKSSINRQNRLGLQDGRLVLVSPFYPESGFNVGNAMGRNKYIYALSDHALVIDCAHGRGGTWEGALENLNQHWVPLHVRVPGDGPGNASLVDKGGIAFSFLPGGAETLREVLERPKADLDRAAEPEDHQPLFLSGVDQPAGDSPNTVSAWNAQEHQESIPSSAVTAAVNCASSTQCNPTSDASAGVSPIDVSDLSSLSLDMYQDFLAKLNRALEKGPLAEEEVAGHLGLEKAQVKVWLRKAVDSGRAERLTKPVRYSLRMQSSLFG